MLVCFWIWKENFPSSVIIYQSIALTTAEILHTESQLFQIHFN